MPEEKNIIEKLEEIPKYSGRVLCGHDNPMVSLKDVKQFLLTELQALKEEVVEQAILFNRQGIKEIFKKRGI
jgi:hypothetical protein